MKSLNGICAVVLNLCYNELIIDTRWTKTFLLDCLPPDYQNIRFQARITCLQKDSWSCIFFFVTSITLSHTSSFLSFFWCGFFNWPQQLSVVIEAICTEGLALCPCRTSFESTENETSTLKRWVIAGCPIVCLDLQIFFLQGVICIRIDLHIFANILNMLLQWHSWLDYSKCL